MSYGVMTLNARNIFAAASESANRIHNVLVTFDTGMIRRLKISASDLDLIREILRCESERVKKAIDRLRCVLIKKSRRRVAVIAYGHFPVTRFHPALVLISHHVTVGARCRVICQVRCASRVSKREQADADQQSRGNRQQQWNSHTACPADKPRAAHHCDDCTIGLSMSLYWLTCRMKWF